MREVLSDLVKQINGLVPALRVTGTPKETVIKGCDDDKTMFVEAHLKQPLPEFEGEFGLTNLTLLNGLLNFANYRTDDATFSVKHRERDGRQTVEQFEFKNKVTGNDAVFRMMDPRHVPEQATIPNIPWNITITPNKSKITEFQQLANLSSEVTKNFSARTHNGDLQFIIGEEGQQSSITMVFEPNVNGSLTSNMTWGVQQFLSVMKLAGANPTTLKITSKGVLSVAVETPYGIYNYYLRAAAA